MPDDNAVSRLLANVRSDEVKFDRRGRAVIDNPELARKLGELGVPEDLDEKASGNGICCGNTNCGPANEVVRLFEGVIGRRINNG